jgi:hypothetical protein
MTRPDSTQPGSGPVSKMTLKTILIGAACVIVASAPHILPNRTSPTIPSAIRASAIVDPTLFHKESYDGWMSASTVSATTERTTTVAQPNSHRSQDDDALSIAASAAFIVPSRKYHAGNGFRIGVAWGASVVAIVLAAFFAVGLYFQWHL